MFNIIGADGKQYGPVSVEQLRSWLTQGRINAQTRIQAVGTEEWRPARDVPELASLFQSSGVMSSRTAPPVLKASDHSVDYTCGRCGTILLHAEENQVHGLLIRCTSCGSYNSTDTETQRA